MNYITNPPPPQTKVRNNRCFHKVPLQKPRMLPGWFLFLCLLSTPFGMTLGKLQGQVHDTPAIELSGFSVSEAFKIPESLPFDIEESNFQKLLYRALQTSPQTLATYANYSSEVTWEQILQQNAEFRTWVFQRRGTVTRVKRSILPGTEPGDPLRQVFRLFCQTENGDSFQVISLNVPRTWLNESHLNQPIEFTGFLYSLIEDDLPASNAIAAADKNLLISNEAKGTSESPIEETSGELFVGVPLFISKYVAWFPTEVNAELGVTKTHVILAQQNVDIAGIERIMRQHGKKLTAAEGPLFFQFLDAIPEIPVDQLTESLGAVELLQNFRDAHGQAVRFQARVRQCAVVRRPANSMSSADDFDQYYQLVVFPDLSPRQTSQAIPLIPNTLDVMPPIEVTDGEKILTYSRFPYTICARSLPDGLTPAEMENQQIWVEGIFYRFWKYESEYTDAVGASGQLSPLIIVNQPQLVQGSSRQLNQFINALLLGFLAIFVACGWTAWKLNRRRNSLKTAGTTGEPLPDRLDTRNFD